MMNDGQYTNLRNYLEEIASLNRQILEEVRRHTAQTPQATAPAIQVPKEAAPSGHPKVTVETVETVDSGKTQEPVESAVHSPTVVAKKGQINTR